MTISCLIPAYNAAPFLAEALESALGQTRPPDEIVVVDDGSTDDTAEIAARYPVRLIRQANRGISGARNACVAAATGERIAWLDADDLWMPDHLERLEAILGDHVMAFGDAVRLFQDGPETETYLDRSTFAALFSPASDEPTVIERGLHKAFLPGLCVSMETTLVRRADAIRAGLFFSGLATSEDRFHMIALSLLGSAVHDPHIHAHARIHGGNTTLASDLAVAKEKLKALSLAETAFARDLDADDRLTIKRLKREERARIRRLSADQGLSVFVRAPGALTDPKQAVRALRSSAFGD
jgi:glycosyltransferase involved in cell wall biosynthesis